MKSKINKPGTNNSNILRGLEATVLMNAGSPINAGSLLNAGVIRPMC